MGGQQAVSARKVLVDSGVAQLEENRAKVQILLDGNDFVVSLFATVGAKQRPEVIVYQASSGILALRYYYKTLAKMKECGYAGDLNEFENSMELATILYDGSYTVETTREV